MQRAEQPRRSHTDMERLNRWWIRSTKQGREGAYLWMPSQSVSLPFLLEVGYDCVVPSAMRNQSAATPVQDATAKGGG